MPEPGDYAAGFIYFSKDSDQRLVEKQLIEEVLAQESLKIIGWRTVPVRSEILGKASSECEPHMEQLFVSRPNNCEAGLPFERKLYLAEESLRINLDTSTILSKTLRFSLPLFLQNNDLQGDADHRATWSLFPRLVDPRMDSALALTHSAFHQHISKLATCSTF